MVAIKAVGAAIITRVIGAVRITRVVTAVVEDGMEDEDEEEMVGEEVAISHNMEDLVLKTTKDSQLRPLRNINMAALRAPFDIDEGNSPYRKACLMPCERFSYRRLRLTSGS